MNKAFLYEMLRTESVSGGEIPLQKKVAAYMREQGAEVETDLAGDVISSINSASPFRVLLCGHIDEIGFRGTHITDGGSGSPVLWACCCATARCAPTSS